MRACIFSVSMALAFSSQAWAQPTTSTTTAETVIPNNTTPTIDTPNAGTPNDGSAATPPTQTATEVPQQGSHSAPNQAVQSAAPTQDSGIKLRRVSVLGDAAIRFANLSQNEATSGTSSTGAVGLDFETQYFLVRAMYVTGTAREMKAPVGDAAYGRSILIPNTSPNSFWFDVRSNLLRGLGPRFYLNASGSTWETTTPNPPMGTTEPLSQRFDVTQFNVGASASYILDITRLAKLPDQSIQLVFDVGYALRSISADNPALIAAAINSNATLFHGFEGSVLLRLNALRVSATLPIFSGDVAGLSGPRFVLTFGLEGSIYDIVSPPSEQKGFIPGGG